MMIKTALKAILLSSLVCTPLIAAGQTATRVQVIVTSEQEKAQSIVADLDQKGFGPAMIEATKSGFKVLSREYASYAEANFAKQHLRGANYPDAFAVKTTNSESDRGLSTRSTQKLSIISTTEAERLSKSFGGASGERLYPKITPYQKRLDDSKIGPEDLIAKANGWWERTDAQNAIDSYSTFIVRFPDASQIPHAKLMRAYWLWTLESRRGDAKREFAQVVEQYPDSLQAGEAALRLAYIALAEGAPDGEALDAFRRVAAGEIVSSAEVRTEAMLRCAALYYRGRDLATAAACYLAIDDSVANEDISAFCKMQLVGIRMEQAWNSGSDFSEARRVAETALEAHPKADDSMLATIALMRMETFAYEQKPSSVIDASEDFFDRFGDTPEATLAMYWTGKALYDAGDYDGSARLLDSLVEANFDSASRFKNIHVTRSSAQLSAQVHEKMGNHARAEEIRRMVFD